MSNPTFKRDQLGAMYDGEEITIWNRVTVHQRHELGHGLSESRHKVLAGDGSTGKTPEYVTPEIRDKLQSVDVYPNVEVIDPTSDGVTLL